MFVLFFESLFDTENTLHLKCAPKQKSSFKKESDFTVLYIHKNVDTLRQNLKVWNGSVVVLSQVHKEVMFRLIRKESATINGGKN